MPVATDNTSRIISVRVPEHLERQLEALAQRGANSVSATVRRLLSYAVNREAREAQ